MPQQHQQTCQHLFRGCHRLVEFALGAAGSGARAASRLAVRAMSSGGGSADLVNIVKQKNAENPVMVYSKT
jgi:hypothetical protein